MGNASSIDTSKSIYIDVSGKTQKIVFSAHCSSHDICQLLAQAVGAERNTEVLVKDGSSALVAVSPTMPLNSPQEPYKVELKDKRQKRETTKEVKHTNNVDTKILQVVLGEVADQFNKSLNKVFQIDEMKSSIDKRLVAIERKMEVDNLKIVEIEKCKREISDMKGQIHSAQKKMVDYSRMSSLSDDRKISLKRDVPAYPKYTLSKETIDYLKQPTFDIWHWEPNEMLSLLEHMYHELELVKHFNINPITLKRWLLCVQENYRNNPFHNFRHCFCVTQMMYGMINLCKLTDYLSKEELGILLTACVCHDLDHPGYNNTYQINARTELSIRYNDISPLENHHCAVAFQILSNPETNIFNNVDSVTFKRIRSGMITLILATDMARHSEILESFKAKIDNFDFTNEDHLNSMKMVLIKCCDISNEVRPMSVSEPWVDCLLEEYFNQSDREKEEGLPVAPFMDREKVTKPTAQIGFIKFVLIPMFETIAKLFNQLDPIMVEPLRGARDHYEELREKNAQKELTTKTDAEKAKEKEKVKEKEKT